MKLNKKQRRTARTFGPAAIALVMMMAAAFLGASNRSHTSTAKYPGGSAARVSHDLRQR